MLCKSSASEKFDTSRHLVKHNAAFRLACCSLHCRYDGDFCTTAQAPLAAERRPKGKQCLASKSITPPLCPQQQTADS